MAVGEGRRRSDVWGGVFLQGYGNKVACSGTLLVTLLCRCWLIFVWRVRRFTVALAGPA